MTSTFAEPSALPTSAAEPGLRPAMNWRDVVRKYQRSNVGRSIWQIANSLIPYFVLWTLMALSLKVSYWLTLALSIPASLFLVRTFIIFHDCGHGSFFKSHRANDIVGIITGLVTFTPYYHWRHEHARHHASAGDLDRRGAGDVWIMTAQEYTALPRLKQLSYRLYRHPLIMFGLGPIFMFLISHRLAAPGSAPRERNNVWATNVTLLAIVVALSFALGSFWNFALVQLPIFFIGGGMGVWLFFVQHTFEGVYWEKHDRWDFVAAALQGSSYYKLPKLLQWFTGNIGIHHIHHLSPRVPNYHLQKCLDEAPIFQEVKPITLISSVKSIGLDLWDEQLHRMIGFREARKLYGV